MLTSYRIGRIEDQTVPIQFVARLTCSILSAFPRHDVPLRFRSMRDAITDVEVTREKYISDIVFRLNLIDKLLTVDSEIIRTIALRLNKPQIEAVKLYTLAYLVPRRDAYQTLAPKATDSDMSVFMGVCSGIATERDMARARMDRVIRALLLLDLDNRFYTITRSIDAPFYTPYGNEHVILGLAHYHPPFVSEFRKAVEPFVRSAYLQRVYDLVRMDFNLFASALMRVEPKSESTAQMEHMIFGEAGHPEGGRVVWAFCSIWFTECVNTFRTAWNLSQETVSRMYALSKEGRTITLLEATRPFGSRIS